LSIITFDGASPEIHESAYISDGSTIIGSAEIGAFSSVWFGAVVRADITKIVIGSRTNIQDGAVIHISKNRPCVIGDYVTIGHNATVHSSTIGSFSVVGVGSVVLDGAQIGEGSIVAAGTIVPPGKEFPPRSLIMGVPGRAAREVTEEEYNETLAAAETYVKLSEEYRRCGRKTEY